jgi:SAM-dependent methyltransferase
MLDSTDLSPVDFHFHPHIGTSIRERLRDAVDAVIRRPLYKVVYRKKFANLSYKIDLVLPEKGMSTLARRQWVNQYIKIRDSRILVIGCGTAWDFGSYLQFKPREIVGIDLYNFGRGWQQVQNYIIQAKLPTKVTFHQGDIAQLDKTLFGEFDIICSDAVFEHCQSLESVLKSMYSLLRSEGIMYASYGPLWYCWGGDHFSGRDLLEHGYNHLLLDFTSYQYYYRNHLQDEAYELQNGGRYIGLDLFSKLSSQEYFDLYKKTGFHPVSVVADFSAQANALLGTSVFDKLIKRFPQLKPDEFLLKGHLVLLKKI